MCPTQAMHIDTSMSLRRVLATGQTGYTTLVATESVTISGYNGATELIFNREISHGSIVVSIPRCGRGDPGSNPGRGRVTNTQSMWQAVHLFSFLIK